MKSPNCFISTQNLIIVPLFLDFSYNFPFICNYLKVQAKCYMNFVYEFCYQVSQVLNTI